MNAEPASRSLFDKMASNGWKRFPLATVAGLCVLAVFVALRQSDPYFVKDLRNRGFDIYQQIKPRNYSPQPVRVVDLDEQSLRELGQWPWPRTTIARLIDRIGQSGAAVIAFDIVFAEKDRLSPRAFANETPELSSQARNELQELPDNELVMRDAISRNRVVLGETSIRNVNDRHQGSSDERTTPRDTPFVQIGEDPRQFLHSFTEIVANLKVLDEVATGRGMFSIEQDGDGIIRRLPLAMNVENSVRFALSAEALRLATGGDSFAIRTTVAGLEGLVIAGQLVSTDPKGNIWPYFAPVPEERYIPASNILNGNFDTDLVNGHIVLIGTSAVGLEDYRSIPLGMRVPGVEIHAQVIENLLTGEKLERPFYALLYELAAIVLVGLVMVFAVPMLGAGWSAVLAAATTLAMISASWIAFSGYRLLLDATWPVLTTLALFLVMAVFNYLREERQKQQIRSAFGQYLSPALVKRLSDNPEHLALGGTTRELSVLFTDIRGFTTLSESYRKNPQGLTQLMNRFLTVLSQPILDRNGTIDKYMGDAIMAFWNAPFDFDDHASQACRAGLDMIREIDKLNLQRKRELENNEDETWQPIHIGIGINSGECVVGNMGSIHRFDYTALGDTVNIASRLEGQSKPYGLPIVIGPDTATAVHETLAVFEIDLLRVKGKNEPIRIFALAGDEEMASQEDFKEFRAINSAMIASCRKQEWNDAIEALEELNRLGEKLALPVADYLLVYEARIREYEENPPGANWDGVYTATSK